MVWPSARLLSPDKATLIILDRDARQQAATSLMSGLGSFDAAARFRTAHDELPDYPRPRTRFNDAGSLAEQRRLCQERWGEVCVLLQAA